MRTEAPTIAPRVTRAFGGRSPRMSAIRHPMDGASHVTTGSTVPIRGSSTRRSDRVRETDRRVTAGVTPVRHPTSCGARAPQVRATRAPRLPTAAFARPDRRCANVRRVHRRDRDAERHRTRGHARLFLRHDGRDARLAVLPARARRRCAGSRHRGCRLRLLQHRSSGHRTTRRPYGVARALEHSAHRARRAARTRDGHREDRRRT